MIHPISFCIPACKVVSEVPIKTREVSSLIPGNLSTQIQNTEEEYYKQQQESRTAHTWKKGGWDCLRHQEILANGCIPLFRNLDQCPPLTMVHYPRHLHTAPELLEQTRNHLTTRAMAQQVLDTIGKPNAKSVLYLSGCTKPDYLRCLMLHGFKELLGADCQDLPRIDHLYTDYPNPRGLYGKGFTQTCLLDPALHGKPKEHQDVIIVGSVHRAPDLSAQAGSEIVGFCGEDCDYGGSQHNCVFTKSVTPQTHLFVRELTCGSGASSRQS